MKLTSKKLNYISNGYGSYKPKTNDFYFGIEIECLIPLSDEIVRYEIVRNKLDKYTTVGTDGSLYSRNEYDNDFEFRVLLKEKEVQTILPKIFKLIKSMGGKVNKSCGMHVHLDMRNSDVRKTYSALFKNRETLNKMVRKDRLKNGYCPQNTTGDFDKALLSYERFAINPQSFRNRSTLEIRLHEGTLDTKKAINWIRELKKHVA